MHASCVWDVIGVGSARWNTEFGRVHIVYPCWWHCPAQFYCT